MQQPIQPLEEKIKGLVERYRNLQAECETLKNDKNEADRTNDSLNARLMEASGRITQLERTLEEKETAMNGMRARLDELESNQREAAGRLDELISQIDEL